jgi:hypothetical protein
MRVDKKVIESGQTVLLMDSVVSHDTLQAGSYRLMWNEETSQIWLERTSDFTMPTKVYGFDDEIRRMVKVKFDSQDRNLGVLLTGMKGQGKTFTAKMVMLEIGLPIISVTRPIPKSIDFVSFLAAIPGSFSMFVDEFEKLFATKEGNNNPNHTQESFLGFMDGMQTSAKILFMLTSNEQVSEYLINRPSRITFLKEYNDMSESVFNDIVEDLLEDKSMTNDLKASVSLLNLNVDLLISIVKDMNLFKRSFSEFAHLYNYRMEMYKWDVSLEVDGKMKWVSMYRTQDKPTAKTTYYGGYNVNDILKMSADEFVFATKNYEYDEEKDERVEQHAVVHMKRITLGKFMF